MAYEYVHLDPNLPPEVALEAQNLQRRQRIAEMLMQRSFHPIQGTQAGRFYVAPGWGGGLGQIGQALIAGHIQGQTERGFRELGEKQRQVAEASMANFMRPMTGQPSSPQYIRGPETMPEVPPSTPVQSPSPNTGEPIPASIPSPPTASPSAAEKVAWSMMPTPMPPTMTADEKIAHALRFMSDLSQPPAVRHAAQLMYQAAHQEQLHAMTKPQTVVSPGATVVGPEGKPLYTAPMTPSMEHTSPLTRLIAERDKLPPDSPLRKTYDEAISKESAGKSQNVSNLARLIEERDALPKDSPLRKTYNEAIKKESEPQARPTVTEVIDPLNPNQTIKIDAKTGKQIGVAGTYSDLAKTFATSKENEIAFTKGKQADSLRSISVAHDHLDTWEKAATALANGDSQTFNRIANSLGKQFGQAAPTNLEGIAAIVAPEIVKAIVPGGGGEAERQALEKKLGTALAPGQSAGIAEQLRALMMGQAQGLKRQYLAGGGTEEKFTQKLSPQLQQRMKAATEAATTQPRKMPAVGEVRKGYKFKGGEPGNPANWEKQ